MKEYIIMFIASFICCFISSKLKHNKIHYIFDILAIFIPAYIAGNRSLEIGTDISVYGHYMQYVASNYNPLYFFSVFGYSDILFSIFTIFIGNLSKNISVYLFALQLLNCLLIYKACKNYEDNIPIYISYLLFLLTLFFRQLNLLRQGLSISIALLAISYLLNGKNKKFWILTILSIFTHISGLLLILIYFVKRSSDDMSNKKVFFASLYFLLTFIFIFFDPMIKLIGSIDLLPIKYSADYFIKYMNINNELDNLGTFFKLSWCIIILLLSTNNKLSSKIKDFSFLYHIVFLDFIFWNLNIYIHYIDRISFYFGYVYMLFLLPQLGNIFKNDFINRFIYYIILILLFTFYWYIRFIVQNAGAVYPYIHI